MKYKIAEDIDGFKPVTITITLENIKEVSDLVSRLDQSTAVGDESNEFTQRLESISKDLHICYNEFEGYYK